MANNIRVTAHYPLQLHYIKALCLAGKYRQCIQACRAMLDTDAVRHHPLQQTFVNFYLGLAHDELARLMHNSSHAKLPSFSQAQKYYLGALESLPPPNTRFEAPATATVQAPEPDPFRDNASQPSPAPTVTNRKISGSRLSSAAHIRSPPTSPPPTYPRTNSLPVRSPAQMASRDTSSSTLTDLESHSSFDQIMTPNRLLPREVSRMSLLSDLDKPLPRESSRMSLLSDLDTNKPRSDHHQQQPPRPNSTTLHKSPSMTQSLLRPIRPGSPPKQYQYQYYIPPRLPVVLQDDGNVSARSRLPRLVTSPAVIPSKTPAASSSWGQSERDAVEEVSPVSPITPGDAKSDAGTISPVSPETPNHAESEYTVMQVQRPTRVNPPPAEPQHTSPQPQHSIPTTPPQQNPTEQNADAIHDHLEALRIQLQTHLVLLEKARQATLAAQAAHLTFSPHSSTITTSTPLLPQQQTLRGSVDSAVTVASSRHDSVQGESLSVAEGVGGGKAGKGFWSFTPVMEEEEARREKRRRIEEGRARGWVRERWRGSAYEGLCERAMAEL